MRGIAGKIKEGARMRRMHAGASRKPEKGANSQEGARDSKDRKRSISLAAGKIGLRGISMCAGRARPGFVAQA